MTLKALAVVGLFLTMHQSALAFVDDKRVLSAHRWYTEAYVKDVLAKRHPSLYKDAFHKSVAYSFAADGPALNLGAYTYYDVPLSIRGHASFLWTPKDAGKNVSAEIDQQCVLLIAKSLSSLKFQVSQALVSARVRTKSAVAVISDIKTGELTAAPLDLSTYKTRPISLIPPEGEGRLLCNVYKSTMRRAGMTYEFSVALAAPGFYTLRR